MSRHTNTTLHDSALPLAARLFPGARIAHLGTGLRVNGRTVLVRVARTQHQRTTTRWRDGNGTQRTYRYTYAMWRWNLHIRGVKVAAPWRWVFIGVGTTPTGTPHVRLWLVPGAVVTGTGVTYRAESKRNSNRHVLCQYEVNP